MSTLLQEVVRTERRTATQPNAAWRWADLTFSGSAFRFDLPTAERFALFDSEKLRNTIVMGSGSEDQITVDYYPDFEVQAAVPSLLDPFRSLFISHTPVGNASLANACRGVHGVVEGIYYSALNAYVDQFVVPEITLGREFAVSSFVWTMKNICDAADPVTLRFHKPALSRRELNEAAMHRIATAFGAFEKVKAVYVQKFRNEFHVNVLLSIEKYDHELMDRLLDVEYDLRKAFADVVFGFFFTPVGKQARSDSKHPSARAIFAR